jgi:peptidoglycan/LPS O-acetylase OafA/YrhL
VLADALSGRNNALNFVRLVLAATVIVAHTWPLGGYGDEPIFGGMDIGSLAVAGFFAISGYLITVSRFRLGFGRFMLNRAVRIFPAFWVCLVIIAFVIAPVVSGATGGPWQVGSALGYVVKNSLLWIVQGGISAGPANVSVPNSWDGSLWTLSYEFAAYLATGLVFSVGFFRRNRVAAAASLLFLCVAVQWLAPWLLESVSTGLYRGIVINSAWLGTFFAAGMLVSFLAHKTPLKPWIAALSVLVLAIATMTGSVRTIGAVPLAVLVLWAGAVLPIRWGASNDISYGVYIYGFPVQQSLAMIGFGTAPFAAFCGVSIAIALPIAALSWVMIERPGMRVIRRRAKTGLPFAGTKQPESFVVRNGDRI